LSAQRHLSLVESSLDTLPPPSGITSVVKDETKTNGTRHLRAGRRKPARKLAGGAPARRRARRSGARQGSHKGARRLVCGGQRAARRCVLAPLRFGSAVHPSLMLHRSTLRTREQLLETNPRIAPLSVFAVRARLRLAAAPGSAQTRCARRGGCARKHHAAEHRWSVPYEHSRIQG
jgi:hypothetical protein